MLWYSAPFTYSPAHDGTPWVTTHRVLAMDRYAQRIARSMGFAVIDATSVTQTQWESAYDGLHYLKGRFDDRWHGKIAGMVFQVALNAVFQECSGQDDSSGGSSSKGQS
jgi:hypothetical protein